MFNIVYIALTLCIITAISLAIALISLTIKKPMTERLSGVIALIATLGSFVIYYYLRIVLSGGGFSDWRVIFVVLVYIIAAILSVLSIVDGNKKLKSNRIL